MGMRSKWVCDQENINFHPDAGAPGDVIVEPAVATGALFPRVGHSCHRQLTAHKLNYLTYGGRLMFNAGCY